MIQSRFIFTVSISISLLVASSRAERVGFTFGGMFLGPVSPVQLFGFDVPENAPISGTFAYDSTVLGIPGFDAGVRDYPQQITGSFTVNIGNNIRLSASQVTIEVSNDIELEEGELSDVFGVIFDRSNSNGPPLLLNNALYAGTAYIQLGFDWPSNTFADGDEPKLTADRPVFDSSDRGSFGIVAPGADESGRFFIIPNVSTIPILAGDYNRNGVVDKNDYYEWKAAFGGTTNALLFADGHGNQVVDAADYTVWRDHLSTSPMDSTGGGRSVSEPASATMAIAATFLFLLHGTSRRLRA
jgi:hypothetical protein